MRSEMKCEQMEQSLIAYLDGKASPFERRGIEAHLAGCGECREQVAEFRLLWGVLDELPVATPSASFDAAVRARVAQESHRANFWSWLVPTPRMAFAVTALVVVSVWLASFQPARRQTNVVAQVTGSEAEFRMIKDLPVLEDYDVLMNFDPLSDLPAQPAQQVPVQQPQM
jgi:anti-sigma factor RsiW